MPGVLDFVDRLKQAGALFFEANPALENRLTDIRKQDARYIAHEYLNQDWHPLMFADVAGAMLEAKCRYIGSATLAENIDTVSVPANVAPILAETRDPYLRETLRDLGCAQAFRRDLYRKGMAPMPAPEQQALLDEYDDRLAGRQVPEGGPTFATPVGTVTGRPRGLPAAAGHAGGRPAQRAAGARGAGVRRAAAGGADAGDHAAGLRRLCASDAAGRRQRRRGTRRRGG